MSIQSFLQANLLIVFTTLVLGSVFILLQVDLGKATKLELVFGFESTVATAFLGPVQLAVQLVLLDLEPKKMYVKIVPINLSFAVQWYQESSCHGASVQRVSQHNHEHMDISINFTISQ